MTRAQAFRTAFTRATRHYLGYIQGYRGPVTPYRVTPIAAELEA